MKPAVEAVLRLTKRYQLCVSCVVFCFGLVWICLFPVVCITTGELKCRGTYFSENALMPGQADTQIDRKRIGFADELDSLMFKDVVSHNIDPVETILSKFQDVGASNAFLHTYNEKTFGEEKTGRNIIATFRPYNGADRRESILLITSFPEYFSGNWTPDNFGKTNCCSGLSILMTLLVHNSGVPWLSKNLLFLVAENEFGVYKFMQDYHSRLGSLAAETKAGRLSAGFVLRLQRATKGASISHCVLATQGINGNLPNLDLLNVAVRVSKNTQLDILEGRDQFSQLRKALIPLVQQYVPREWHSEANLYLSRMETLLRFMYRVGFSPTGWHAHLLPYRVDALSFIGVETSGNKVDAPLQIAESVQHMIRSISNLDEKLHQSYYLYLIPDKRLFVSINEYSGVLVCIMVPIISKFVFLAIARTSEVNSTGTNTVSAFIFAVIVLISILLIGTLLLIIPHVFDTESGAKVVSEFSFRNKESFYCRSLMLTADTWLAFIFLATIGFVLLIFPRYERLVAEEGCKDKQWESAKLSLMLYLFVACVLLGVVNFPFTVTFAAYTVPFYYCVSPSEKLMKKMVLLVWWFITSPIVAITWFSFVTAGDSFWESFNVNSCDHLGSMLNVFRGILLLISSYMKYGTMYFPFVCLVYVPIHVVSLWIILYQEKRTTTSKVKKE